jgi:type IV secretory pathway TraG/TraD family ATPase VirD4
LEQPTQSPKGDRNMWLWLKNMFSDPGRNLKQLLITIAGIVVLLVALALSGPAVMGNVVAVIGILAFLRVCRVIPSRIFTYLVVVTILIAGAASLVAEVLAGGVLPLVLAGGAVAGIMVAWLRNDATPRSRGARWATIRDLRRAGFLGDHGFPLGTVDGHTVRLPVELERQSTLVTATTGSGKTSILVIPPLIEETKRPVDALRSIVILDHKDELARATMPTLARTHRVLLWDPSDPGACTVGFDPLSTLPDPSDESFVAEVKQLAQSWFWASRGGNQTTDPFWINQPRSLMETLFLAFLLNRPKGTFVELADWARTIKIEEFQALLDQATHPALRASAETLRTLGMSDRTVGPIFADVLQRFDVLDDPRVRRSMTGAPVDSSFVTQPTALYIRVGA